MVEKIEEFFNLISNPYLSGFLIAMVPLVELKGAIPYIFFRLGGKGFINIVSAFFLSVVGSTLVSPIALLIFNPIIAWMKRTKLFHKAGEWMENHFKKKSDALEKKAESKQENLEENTDNSLEEKKKKRIENAKYWGIFIFTAIPLPLTGCWTASIVASILHLKFGKSILFIALGNILAGLIVASLCFGLGVIL